MRNEGGDFGKIFGSAKFNLTTPGWSFIQRLDGVPNSKPSFKLSEPTCGGKYLSRVSFCNQAHIEETHPRYMFLLLLTNVFLANFIFSSSDSPFLPKKLSQRLNTSSWENVKGRSAR